jgi:hypothetical protein
MNQKASSIIRLSGKKISKKKENSIKTYLIIPEKNYSTSQLENK